MKKEAIAFLSFLSIIFIIPIVSAFSFSDVLSFVDAQTVFILVCFGVLGLLLSAILNRFPAFKGTTAGVMSLLLSLGMTYGITKWLNVNDMFSGFGISTDFLVYLPLILLILFIISIFFFKDKALMISGLLLIILALFTDMFAENGIVLAAGIILLLIGFIWMLKKKGLNWKGLFLIVPGLALLIYGFLNQNTLLMIIGGVLTLLGIIMLFFKKNALTQNPQQAQQQAQQKVNGIRRLIIEARAYRQWADQQPNPKMYRNWAHFINYLKGRGYGNNEKEICQRMTVTQKNISDVVKKYIL